ncbi:MULTISPECIES: hypothetical protein [Streptomyces]|uniref:hypothetical protein n=1 Tax=Streptomyces TaxID=1883 RepID=UPI003685E409
MKNRNFRMPEPLSNLLDAVAEGKGMNPSQVVRLAVTAYVRNATEELKLSHPALAEAALELSSNRRTAAVELSNAVQGDTLAVAEEDLTDGQLVAAWGRTYDRKS